MCVIFKAIFALLFAAALSSVAQALPMKEGNAILKDFTFRSGEKLAEVRIHYTTLGTPHRNAKGEIDNAVMVLHGTGGSGKQFLQPQFAGELYGSGQPLDITRWYVILPDNLGHGASSKPSDGMKMAFPKYDYDDMVETQRRMFVEGLKITKLKLIFGTSMGCMHAFVWGETHPDFAERLAAFACLPVEIAGRNRMWRKMAIDGIKADPAWNDGNYSVQPAMGIRNAVNLIILASANPLALQQQFPTRAEAEANLDASFARMVKDCDANDLIYQLDASRSYNPWSRLEEITARMLWINSADDFINPPGYGITEAAIKRLKSVTFILISATGETKGHGTHTWAKFWKNDLATLMAK